MISGRWAKGKIEKKVKKENILMLTRVNIRKSFAPKEHRMLMLNATCDDVFCDTLLYVVSNATALVRSTVKYVHVEGCMHQQQWPEKIAVLFIIKVRLANRMKTKAILMTTFRPK